MLEVGEHTPSDLPVAKFAAHRTEALEFARQIYFAGRLYLATIAEAPGDQRMHLISPYKSPTVDRTVWDRRRRNYLEEHLKGAASDMPAGYDLTDIEVPDGHYAHMFCDDVSEMYPSFIFTTQSSAHKRYCYRIHTCRVRRLCCFQTNRPHREEGL